MQTKIEDVIKKQLNPIPNEWKKKKPKLELHEISSTERERILNSILDKGFENLTEEDKNILEKLKNIGE